MSSDGWVTVGFLGACVLVGFMCSQFRACEVAGKASYTATSNHEVSSRPAFVQACKAACGERGVNKVHGGECECK
jgi:hypothetical protein